jgi:serine/threonine-protein kinase ATR
VAAEEPKHTVGDVLSCIPQDVIAKASLRCRAYARALLHYEQFLRKVSSNETEATDLHQYYQFLQEIYSNIDEPDGMDGITSKIHGNSLEHQILEHRATGEWVAAQTCYEVSLQQDPDCLRNHLGLLDCLKNMGHLGKGGTNGV